MFQNQPDFSSDYYADHLSFEYGKHLEFVDVLTPSGACITHFLFSTIFSYLLVNREYLGIYIVTCKCFLFF